MKKALDYLPAAVQQFTQYKTWAEKTFERVSDDGLHWQPNEEVNSITMTVQHMWGNMVSRWTDFLTTDGEKPWRERDLEFEVQGWSREEMLNKWNEGWKCVFDTLAGLTEADLKRIVTIRQEPHTVEEAIARQLCHYGYHVGQIVLLGKVLLGDEWQSLSIPRKKTKP